MRFYKIVGQPVGFGLGAVLCLSASQFAVRAHRVTKMDMDWLTGGILVRLNEPLKFKVGEVIGLDQDPDKSQADLLEPVDIPAAKAASASTSEPVVRAPPVEKFKKDGSRRISHPNAPVGQKAKPGKPAPIVTAAPAGPAGAVGGSPAPVGAGTDPAAAGGPAGAPAAGSAPEAGSGSGDGVAGDA